MNIPEKSGSAGRCVNSIETINSFAWVAVVTQEICLYAMRFKVFTVCNYAKNSRKQYMVSAFHFEDFRLIKK